MAAHLQSSCRLAVQVVIINGRANIAEQESFVVPHGAAER
jgi:hypothetical protein